MHQKYFVLHTNHKYGIGKIYTYCTWLHSFGGALYACWPMYPRQCDPADTNSKEK